MGSIVARWQRLAKLTSDLSAEGKRPVFSSSWMLWLDARIKSKIQMWHWLRPWGHVVRWAEPGRSGVCVVLAAAA